MGFQQGLSGLNGSARSLDVIGNNIANTSTIGFKASRTDFADVYANSLYGAAGGQAGIGSKVAAVSQQFSQGNLSQTTNPLDVAINGNGFFRMSQGTTISYSRNGQFHLDRDGYMVNSTGQRLTGTSAAGAQGDLQVSFASAAPNPTSTLALGFNLDSRKASHTVSAPPVAGDFSPATATSFDHSTAVTLYDERGNAQTLNLYFQKTSGTVWDVYGSLVNAAGSQVNLAGGATINGVTGYLGNITYGTDGTFASTTIASIPVAAAALGTGAAALAVTPDFSTSTLYGSSFGVTSLSQNGYAQGNLANVTVSEDGYVQGRYTNGVTQNLGQITLVSFNNTQGLAPIGNNQWLETYESGQPTSAQAPGSGTLGLLQAGTVEEANVDLTAELVNMIVAQRMYQANAQTIKTQDSILQTLVNLR
ncbi:MAG: flagellar hook protein FlgE [Gallionellaceae bacterium]|nr:flagellar hook protein FlgE [Gallionellaceae bacterium]